MEDMGKGESTGAHPGEVAPGIDLPMIEGGQVGRWQLSAFRGRPVILIFYPGDETPVCTRQLCAVRDRWTDYEQTGAVVVGINSDSLDRHRQFIAHHHFPFPLLFDEGGAVVRAYQMNNFLGVRRGVVVIDRHGIIRYRKVLFPLFRPSDDEILLVVNGLQ
jgi:peroxiredoxin Q/BCP